MKRFGIPVLRASGWRLASRRGISAGLEELASRLAVWLTETGAASLRPARRIPNRPSSGSPTRTMYTSTNFRFVYDIASPTNETQKRKLETSAPCRPQRLRQFQATARLAAETRPRSNLPAVYATGAFRSVQP